MAYQKDICNKCGAKYDDILGIGKCGDCFFPKKDAPLKKATTTPLDKLDKEAQSLIETFRFRSIGENNYDYAKQCAIICIDYLIKEVPIYSDAAYKYTTLKQKIEAL